MMLCTESGLCCRNFVCPSISDIFVNWNKIKTINNIFSLTETKTKTKNYCQNENEIETKITEMETK